MSFATLTYGLFLAMVTVAYWTVGSRVRAPLLLAASLVFYGSWNVLFVPGFVVLIGVNWSLGLLASVRPKLAVSLAIAADLGLLGLFKYADWLVGSSASVVSHLMGTEVGFHPFGLILPLAISFVTFTLLAYVVDVGRGMRAEANPWRFAMFIAFFPHLIAGPILRGREFLPQVRHMRPWAAEHLRLAAPWLISGFLKKTLADNLAPAVATVFADPSGFSTAGVWIGILSFAFQIYFDFSGYTDFALGSAALLGFRLPQNFNWPYRATSIQEFWRRWHMTLSRWLRDYIYIPLGGSRHGVARTYLALALTWILGGLWHGAGLTFLVWGTYLAASISIHRWYSQHRTKGLPVGLAWALTFMVSLIGWVFFRATSMSNAADMLREAFTLHGGAEPGPLVALLCAALLAGQWPGWQRLFRRLVPPASYRRYAVYGTAVAIGVLLVPVRAVTFIYFQF